MLYYKTGFTAVNVFQELKQICRIKPIRLMLVYF